MDMNCGNCERIGWVKKLVVYARVYYKVLMMYSFYNDLLCSIYAMVVCRQYHVIVTAVLLATAQCL